MKKPTLLFTKNLLLFLIVAFFSFTIQAQTDLYWTGATNNNFSVGGNWSTIPLNPDGSGGDVALSGPSIGTNVHFVAGSFPVAQAYTVTFDSGITVRDFLVEDLGLATGITFNGGALLTISENLAIVPPAGILQFNKSGTILFSSPDTNNTIDFGGNPLTSFIEFNNPNGGWQFTNGLATNLDITLNDGALNFNSHTFTARRLILTGQGATTSVAMGTGTTFNLTYAFLDQSANNPGIYSFQSSGTFASFTGSNMVFNKVNGGNTFRINFEHTSTAGDNITIDSINHIGNPLPTVGTIIENRIRIRGINTVSNINTITASDGSVIFERSIAYNVNTINVPFEYGLYATGTGTVNLTTLNVTGMAAYVPPLCLDPERFIMQSINLDFVAGRPVPDMRFVTLGNVDVLESGAAPVAPGITVTNSIDVGSNNGWDIQTPAPPAGRDMYWIGNTGNYSETVNWSYSSGGAALDPLTDCPPRVQDNVFFDANSFNADGQIVTIDAPSEANNMLWQGLDQTDIDWVGTETLELGGDLTLDANMVEDLSYAGTLAVRDNTGTFDFQSGTDNRNMPNMIVNGLGGTNVNYTQLSDEVEILRMNQLASYNIGGTAGSNHILRTVATATHQGISDVTTLNMEYAQIYSQAIGYAMNRVTTILYTEPTSHVYFEGGANTTWTGTFSTGTLPDITVPNATQFQAINSPGGVDGDALITAGFYTNAHYTITGTVTFNGDRPNQSITGNVVSNSITAGTLISTIPNCANAYIWEKLRINVAPANLDVQYNQFENCTYIGDAGNPIDLTPQNAVDNGGNTDIIIGGPGGQDPRVTETFYWRPRVFDPLVDDPALNSTVNPGFVYDGNFLDPRHWALSQAATIGQTPACGVTMLFPREEDNVVFDNLSGDGTQVQVTVDGGFTPYTVGNVTWVDGGANGVPDNMELKFTIYSTLRVNGDFEYAANMMIRDGGLSGIIMQGTGTYDVNTKGINLHSLGNLQFHNGTFNVTGDILGINNRTDIVVTNGATFNHTDPANTVRVQNFTVNGASTLDIRDATVTLNSSSAWSFSDDSQLLAEGSTINAGTLAFAAGNNHVYNNVVTAGGFTLGANSNSSINLLEVGANGAYNSDFSVGILRLTTNTTHTFVAGGTTTFLPEGNIEKIGNSNDYVTLTSNNTSTFHDFAKPTGGSVFVCNINITRINASGMPFKSNAPDGVNGGTFYVGSTGVPLNGAPANAQALADNASNSWNFEAVASTGELEMLEPQLHYNFGDLAAAPFQIDQNDTGPYQITFTGSALPPPGTDILNLPADGTVTNGTFEIQATIAGSANIEIQNFEYYQCPGFYEPGTIDGTGITILSVPSLLGKNLAGDGDTETYTLNNLQNYVYIMNDGDQTDHTVVDTDFDLRLPQLAIQDGLDAEDTDVLGDITSTVTIDGSAIEVNNNVYLTRRWEFTNTGDNGDANVRFFITEAELQALKTAANSTETDADFLAILVLEKAANGETPATTASNTVQQYVSSGIATEIGTTTYYYEALVSGFAGTYALATNAPPLDSDGDNIPDNVDLDDDNDGILDSIEACPITLVNPSFEDTSGNNQTSLPGWVVTGNVDVGPYNPTDGTNALDLNGNTTGSISQEVTTVANSLYEVSLDYAANTFTSRQMRVLIEDVTSGDILFTEILTKDGLPPASASYDSYSTIFETIGTNIRISFISLVTDPPTILGGIILDNVALTFIDCDADGDGIPNRFDLDSDDDGCSDAFEAGTTTDTTANFAFDGTNVGANGFEDTLETAEDGVYTATYTYDRATDGGSWCDDNDGDNVPDFVDLDDDNDGILDTEECSDPIVIMDLTNGNGSGETIIGTQGANSNVSALPGFTNLIGSADILLTPNLTAAEGGANGWGVGFGNGVTASPDGGNFVTAYYFIPTNREGFNYAVNGMTIGTEYTLEFYQIYAGVEGTDPTSNIPVGEFGRWKVTTPNGEIFTPEMDFKGPGNQVWQQVFFTFTATTTNFNIAFEADPGTDGIATGTFGDVMGIDGIVVYDSTQNTGGPLSCDTDGDGIPNVFDLDSDNDGIHDVIEVGGIDSSTELIPSDGRADDDDDNADNTATNGIPTSAGAGLTVPNTDGTDGGDPYDTDSDDDGCSDANEAYQSANADGGDGEQYGTGTPAPINPDGTVISAGYYTGTVAAVTDSGDSGICAIQDSDCDGVPDHLDQCPGDDNADFDNDGVPDGCDLDDDNDGISDIVEMNGINPDEDSDGDCIPNWADETVGGSGDRILNVYDKDYDSVPNHRDLDSDNDGIFDVVEAKGVDSNNDGIADDDDNNADNTLSNGLPTSAGAGINPVETTPSILDMFNLDSDGDGCSDANEAYDNPTADGGDDGHYGNYPVSINPNGTVAGAAYNTGYVAAVVSYITITDGDGIIIQCNPNAPIPAGFYLLGVEEIDQVSFKIYPNPADTMLTIISAFDIDSVEIYNTLGARILVTQNNNIDVSYLDAGLYLVKIQSNDKIETKRLVIK